MRISVNGNDIEVAENITVSALLDHMGFPERGIAVAVDSTIMPCSQWDSTVPAGAEVEVVTAVQGG